MRLIDADELIRFIIKKLVTLYYKRTRFLAFSWGIDESTDVSILSEEYSLDGYRIGTKEVRYDKENKDE